ncbi:hypothetical protein EVAR_27479_1 [Eumeta japonica]|uniref:Uncharacterized protein n=1 Tax=Eumeta variegata TaxID=151549 RepID=A0A4C1XF39_EUMVA|nr:hypothetical protein EVAR_27479_1 [Eumeta japonica]
MSCTALNLSSVVAVEGRLSRRPSKLRTVEAQWLRASASDQKILLNTHSVSWSARKDVPDGVIELVMASGSPRRDQRQGLKVLATRSDLKRSWKGEPRNRQTVRRRRPSAPPRCEHVACHLSELSHVADIASGLLRHTSDHPPLFTRYHRSIPISGSDSF